MYSSFSLFKRYDTFYTFYYSNFSLYFLSKKQMIPSNKQSIDVKGDNTQKEEYMRHVKG